MESDGDVALGYFGANQYWFTDSLGNSELHDYSTGLSVLRFQFAGRYELFAEADGAVFGTDDDFIDYSVQFRARIGRRWDLSVGFRRFEYRFETQDLKNHFDLDRWFLGYGYSW